MRNLPRRPPKISPRETGIGAEVLAAIKPQQSIGLLQALHILTRDAKLNQDSRRKLKQVYHLYQFIEPLLAEVQATQDEPTLVDHGAGKSYLGFILYDLYTKQQPGGHIYGIEARPELVERSRALAAELGFARMTFLAASVADAIASPELPTHVDIVTALHACDTATDDAIQFALAKRAKHIVLAPCCQAEVARALRENKSASLGGTALAELWRHPLHTRELGSQLTNVLRCLQLEAAGYAVTVTELVGWEHSLKNELIIASDKNTPRKNAVERMDHILEAFNLTSLRSRFMPAGPST